MKEVYKGLWVGADKDVPKAKEKGMAIVHAAKDGDFSHRSLLKYTAPGAPKDKEYLSAKRTDNLYLNLVDTDNPNFVPDELVNTALDFIAEELPKKPVLIHCNKGQSRGPTIAFLYLYKHGKLPYEYYNAVRTFRQLYPDYEPSVGLRMYARNKISELKHRS